jgi:hypothetical protein
MPNFIIKDYQYKKLLETVMDLDIYNQSSTVDASNGNENIQDSIEGTIDNLNEILSLFKTGKKIPQELKNEVFGNLDRIRKTYSKIKYGE